MFPKAITWDTAITVYDLKLVSLNITEVLLSIKL